MKYLKKMTPKTPPAPSRLSVEAKKWWTKFVAEWSLDDAGLLILESALESFDRMRAAQAIIATEGIVLTDRFGQKKQHPATLIERDSKAAMARDLKALNLDLEPLRDAPGRPPGGQS
jgi:P27 family predicted phage terminase small subunit